MKADHDFSNAERGKFYRPDPKLNLPVYLDDEVLGFVEEIAKKRESDVSTVVNQILRGDMKLAEAMR